MFEDLAAFLGMINAFMPEGPNIAPSEDVTDLANGARIILDEVTDARRAGQTVKFVQIGGMGEWYWEMPNGERVMHGIYS